MGSRKPEKEIGDQGGAKRPVTETTAPGEENISLSPGVSGSAVVSTPAPEMTVDDQIRITTWRISLLERQHAECLQQINFFNDKQALATEHQQVEQQRQEVRQAQKALEVEKQRIHDREKEWRATVQNLEDENNSLRKENEELREQGRQLEETLALKDSCQEME